MRGISSSLGIGIAENLVLERFEAREDPTPTVENTSGVVLRLESKYTPFRDKIKAGEYHIRRDQAEIH